MNEPRARFFTCVFCAAFFVAVHHPVFAQSDYSFWDRTGQKELTLVTDKIGIRFRDGVSPEEREAVLERELGPASAQAIRRLGYRPPVHFVALSPGAGVLGTIQQLNSAEEVYYATPLFKAPDTREFKVRTRFMEPGYAADQIEGHRARVQRGAYWIELNLARELMLVSATAGIYPQSLVVRKTTVPEVVLSNMLVLHIRDEEAEQELQPYLNQEGIQTLTRSPKIGGIIDVKLAVETTTGLEALEWANIFHDSGLTVLAVPIFLPLRRFDYALASPQQIAEIEAANAPPTPPEDGYYYQVGPRKIVTLALSLEKLGFRFREGLPDARKEEVVASFPDMLPLDLPNQREIVTRHNMVVVSLRQGRSEQAVEALVASLKNHPDIAFGAPVFQSRPGKDMLLTDEFYAEFSAETDSAEIEQLFAQYGLEVVTTRDYSRVGKMGYYLRMPEDSPVNALEMANIFHRHPLTIATSPSFLPLYPATLATPNDAN